MLLYIQYMKKRAKIIWITIGILFIGMMVPGWLNQNIARRNQFTQTQVDYVTELAAELEQNFVTPQDLLLRLFKDHDIILLGEMPKVSNHVYFLSQLIPVLYDNGIRDIGYQYVLYQDQAELDRITTAAVFDDDGAKQLLFNYLVIWGYEEYLQVIRSVWSFNVKLEQGAEKMRLVGLSPFQDYTHIEVEADISDLDILKKVQAEGSPDQFMAEVVQKEFTAGNRKALVYTDSKHVFTRYTLADYTRAAAELGLENTGRLGNILLENGVSTGSVFLHALWPDKEARIGLEYAAGGLLDRLLQVVPAKYRTAGVDLRESSPFASVPITTGLYAEGKSSLSLGDLWDGYIFVGRLHSYRGTMAIDKFITNANFEQTLANFPGPKIIQEDISVKDLNTYIKRGGEQITSIIQTF